MSAWESATFGDKWIKVDWLVDGMDVKVRLSCKQLDGYHEFDSFTISPHSPYHHKEKTLYLVVKVEYTVEADYKTGAVRCAGTVSPPAVKPITWDKTITHIYSLSHIQAKSDQMVRQYEELLAGLIGAGQVVVRSCPAELDVLRKAFTSGEAATVVSDAVRRAMKVIAAVDEVAAVLDKATPAFGTFGVEFGGSVGTGCGLECAVGVGAGFGSSSGCLFYANTCLSMGVDEGAEGDVGLGLGVGGPSDMSGPSIDVITQVEGDLGGGVAVSWNLPDVTFSGFSVTLAAGEKLEVSVAVGECITFPPLSLG